MVQNADATPAARLPPVRRLKRAWLVSHVAFWLIYLAFRAAAAATDPSYDQSGELFGKLMANRVAVTAALALITGALLAWLAQDCERGGPQARGGLIAIIGAVLLIPVARWIEGVSAYWFVDGTLMLTPNLSEPALIAFAFQFGWVLILWAVVQTLVGYHYIVIEQRDRLSEAQSLHQQAQLEMLRYQLNPHFLFNTLNAISTLVLERRNAEAERMLLRLCDFLRYSLEGDQQALEPVAKEIEAQRAYLEIEKARFGARLDVQFTVEGEAERAMAPPLILQPLLENAIKHAVAPSPDGARIEVNVRREGAKLVMTIDDDGSALACAAKQPGVGLGLSNARRRIALHYGEAGSLTAGPKEPQGYRAEIVVPFAPSPEKRR